LSATAWRSSPSPSANAAFFLFLSLLMCQ
jgi:hypothetical protein